MKFERLPADWSSAPALPAPDKSAAAAVLAGLDKTTARLVRRAGREINTLLRRSAENILIIGRKLIEIRDLLQPHHGLWAKWLVGEFGWSDETARRFIHVAQEYSTKPQIVAYAPSALYLLSAPSVPQEARDEAEAIAETGTAITSKLAQDIIAGKRKPAEVMAELPPEEQLNLLALTRQHYERKIEARHQAAKSPEQTEQEHLDMAAQHLRLARKHLEFLTGNNARARVLKHVEAALRDRLFKK